jgi:anti-anti-sigma factor
VDVVIRLPLAPPQDYLLWLDWWTAVEEIASARIGAGEPEAEPARSGRRLIPVHLRLVGAQARAALERGHNLVAPELAADDAMWSRAMDHADRIRARLRDLEHEDVTVPEFPEKLAGLRDSVTRVIREGLEGPGPFPSRGLQLVPRPAPGHFRLVGQLDLVSVDQVEEACLVDLDAGARVRLDLSGVTLMDSQGLRLLIRLGGLAIQRGLDPVTLANPSAPVQRVLKRAVPRGIPGTETVDLMGEFDGPPR